MFLGVTRTHIPHTARRSSQVRPGPGADEEISCIPPCSNFWGLSRGLSVDFDLGGADARNVFSWLRHCRGATVYEIANAPQFNLVGSCAGSGCKFLNSARRGGQALLHYCYPGEEALPATFVAQLTARCNIPQEGSTQVSRSVEIRPTGDSRRGGVVHARCGWGGPSASNPHGTLVKRSILAGKFGARFAVSPSLPGSIPFFSSVNHDHFLLFVINVVLSFERGCRNRCCSNGGANGGPLLGSCAKCCCVVMHICVAHIFIMRKNHLSLFLLQQVPVPQWRQIRPFWPVAAATTGVTMGTQPSVR